MSKDTAEIELQHAAGFKPLSMKAYVIIAAFITSWAYLKLRSLMYKLGTRVLFHDIDSIIFCLKDVDQCIPLFIWETNCSAKSLVVQKQTVKITGLKKLYTVGQ